MDESRARLIKCFELVFPDLPEDQVPSASQATLPEWDSVAAITMMNVIEDEFGFESSGSSKGAGTGAGVLKAFWSP